MSGTPNENDSQKGTFMTDQSALPLAGVRVVEFTHMVMGPACGVVLADLGADVVKVEPVKGDNTRRLIGSGAGYFPMYNRNKRSVCLDLKSEAGHAAALRLIREADVLIENFRPGAMDKLGFGYEDLKAINPRLVMVRVTGFGQTGPYKNRPGFGTVAEVFSGFANITGEKSGPPTLPNFGLADGIAAAYGTFATMSALYHRDAQGSGG